MPVKPVLLLAGDVARKDDIIRAGQRLSRLVDFRISPALATRKHKPVGNPVPLLQKVERTQQSGKVLSGLDCAHIQQEWAMNAELLGRLL